MGYKMERVELDHGHSEIRVFWPCNDGTKKINSVVHQSGDDCIQIGIPKKYLYGGEEVELLYKSLGIYVREYRSRKRKRKLEHNKLVASKLPIARCSENKWKEKIENGYAVQFYLASSKGLIELSDKFKCDAYATERNGDPIGMLVKSGTSREKLPISAMDYYEIAPWWDAGAYHAMPDVS